MLAQYLLSSQSGCIGAETTNVTSMQVSDSANFNFEVSFAANHEVSERFALGSLLILMISPELQLGWSAAFKYNFRHGTG